MGKKKDEDLELDLAGVNGLRNSDYTFTLSIMLLSMRVAVILLGVLIYFRPVIFYPHKHRWCHFVQMGHVGFDCHSFFFCVHLASWSSRCAVSALAPTVGLINTFFL